MSKPDFYCEQCCEDVTLEFSAAVAEAEEPTYHLLVIVDGECPNCGKVVRKYMQTLDVLEKG